MSPILSLVFLSSIFLRAQYASSKLTVVYDLADETPVAALIGNLAESLAPQLQTEVNFVLMTSGHFQYLSDFFRLSSNGDLTTIRHIDRDNRNEICGPLSCCKQIMCQIKVNVVANKLTKIINNSQYGPAELPNQYRSSSPDQINVELLIRINDANDNPPLFLPATVDVGGGLTSSAVHRFNLFIREGASVKPETLPVAMDADSQPNGIIEYRFQELTESGIPVAQPKFKLNMLNYRTAYPSENAMIDFTRSEHPPPELLQLQPLDYEQVSERQINAILTAVDGGQPQLTGTLSLIINLLDVNDNPPKFTHSQKDCQLSIPENTTLNGKPIFTVQAMDPDSGDNGRITYGLSPLASPDVTSKFTVDPGSGAIRIRSPMDYEVYSERQFVLPILAKDGGTPHLSSTISLFVNVMDVNDNIPSLVVQENITIPEGEYLTKPILKFYIKDEDEISNGKVRCQSANLSILSSLDSELEAGRTFLRLHAVSDTVFFVFTKAVLDYETTPRASLLLKCVDLAENSNGPRKKATNNLIRVTVAVEDRNDNAPHFEKEQYHTEILEHSVEGTKIAQVRANDADSGEFGKLTYQLGTILPEPSQPLHSNEFKRVFVIEPDTGTVKVARQNELDRELVDTFRVQVIAKDKGGLSTSTDLLIRLIDINDCSPLLVGSSKFTLEENQRIDTIIGRIHYIDRDQGKNSRIHILPNANAGTAIDKYVRLAPDTNFRYVLPNREDHNTTRTSHASELIGESEVRALLVSQMPVDRETYNTLFFELIAFDEGEPANSISSTFTIQITDQNDNAPVPIFPLLETTVGSHPPVYQNSPFGSHVTRIRSVDADQGENGTVSYQLNKNTNGSQYFHLNKTSGELTTKWTPKPKIIDIEQDIRSTHRYDGPKDQDAKQVPAVGIYLVKLVLSDGGVQPQQRDHWFFVYVGPENPSLTKLTNRVSSNFLQVSTIDEHNQIGNKLLLIMFIILGSLVAMSIVAGVFWIRLGRKPKAAKKLGDNSAVKPQYNPLLTKFEQQTFGDANPNTNAKELLSENLCYNEAHGFPQCVHVQHGQLPLSFPPKRNQTCSSPNQSIITPFSMSTSSSMSPGHRTCAVEMFDSYGVQPPRVSLRLPYTESEFSPAMEINSMGAQKYGSQFQTLPLYPHQVSSTPSNCYVRSSPNPGSASMAAHTNVCSELSFGDHSYLNATDGLNIRAYPSSSVGYIAESCEPQGHRLQSPPFYYSTMQRR